MNRAASRHVIADSLARAGELDRVDSPQRVLTADWAIFDELDAAVRHARAPLRRNAILWGASGVVAILAVFVAIVAVESSALPGLVRLVISTALVLVLASAAKVLLEYPGYRSTRAWMHGPAIAHPVYLAGGSPYARRRMMFGRHGLYLIAEDGSLSQVPWTDISVAGVDVRLSGAVIVLAVDGRFVAVSTAGRVDGPLALAWTVGWFGQWSAFKRALLAGLEQAGVPVATVDWSALAL